MNAAPASIFRSAQLPGWFGKLPGMGDFAHRRLPEDFRAVWDAWLQRGLARLKDRHADWVERYLEAPVWCFALGPRVVGERGWIGVLMPSVDGVGRYFPFTLAVELDEACPKDLQGDGFVALLRWWALATQAALEGLEEDLDALRFDAVLQRVFADGAGQDVRQGTVELLTLPAGGDSLWLDDPGLDSGVRMACSGLPVDEQFDWLFLGFAQEG